MNPTSRTKLHEAEQRYYRTNYPSVPAHCTARTQYKDNTSNGLTRCIIDYIRFTGGYGERINTMGRQIKTKANKQIWVRGGGSNGSSDISAVVQGKAIRIEVKCAATHDRIRPNQIRYAERVQAAGAIYYIARDFDTFLVWYEELAEKQVIQKLC